MLDVALVVVVVLVPYDVVAPASSIFLEPSFAFPPELQPPLKSRSGWKWAADASSHQLLDANSLELLSRKFLLFSNVFFSTTIEYSLIG